uniref:Apple domain-containing protein n=1 Tax=Romanomermis culicivorax TaxID=13658 RepID=A0A915HI10_ROMCU
MSTFSTLNLLICLIMMHNVKPDYQKGYNNGYQILWHQDCDFAGYDFSNSRSSPGQCVSKCTHNSDCTHFAWFNGVCYLKHSTWMKIAYAAAPKPKCICGINMPQHILLTLNFTSFLCSSHATVDPAHGFGAITASRFLAFDQNDFGAILTSDFQGYRYASKSTAYD